MFKNKDWFMLSNALLNFFRAEAERRRRERNVPSVIYAIEEPETSQHTAHQKILIRALLELLKLITLKFF